ncbi:MAG: YkgJ family cysteine cluster protein [Victivallaceae bacterium]|nr:YkgJ family cysteine cluster protein [Victivallaceae bacterium]
MFPVPEQFHCLRCGNCCRWEGYVHLSGDEAKRIAEFLELTLEEFTARYTRLTEDRRGLSLTEKPDGSCIFLETSKSGYSGCKIQDVKPEQCDAFPRKWRFEHWEDLCVGAAHSRKDS